MISGFLKRDDTDILKKKCQRSILDDARLKKQVILYAERTKKASGPNRIAHYIGELTANNTTAEPDGYNWKSLLRANRIYQP